MSQQTRRTILFPMIARYVREESISLEWEERSFRVAVVENAVMFHFQDVYEAFFDDKKGSLGARNLFMWKHEVPYLYPSRLLNAISNPEFNKLPDAEAIVKAFNDHLELGNLAIVLCPEGLPEAAFTYFRQEIGKAFDYMTKHYGQFMPLDMHDQFLKQLAEYTNREFEEFAIRALAQNRHK